MDDDDVDDDFFFRRCLGLSLLRMEEFEDNDVVVALTEGKEEDLPLLLLLLMLLPCLPLV